MLVPTLSSVHFVASFILLSLKYITIFWWYCNARSQEPEVEDDDMDKLYFMLRLLEWRSRLLKWLNSKYPFRHQTSEASLSLLSVTHNPHIHNCVNTLRYLALHIWHYFAVWLHQSIWLRCFAWTWPINVNRYTNRAHDWVTTGQLLYAIFYWNTPDIVIAAWPIFLCLLRRQKRLFFTAC